MRGLESREANTPKLPDIRDLCGALRTIYSEAKSAAYQGVDNNFGQTLRRYITRFWEEDFLLFYEEGAFVIHSDVGIGRSTCRIRLSESGCHVSYTQAWSRTEVEEVGEDAYCTRGSSGFHPPYTVFEATWSDDGVEHAEYAERIGVLHPATRLLHTIIAAFPATEAHDLSRAVGDTVTQTLPR